jgi:hypothetical protein
VRAIDHWRPQHGRSKAVVSSRDTDSGNVAGEMPRLRTVTLWRLPNQQLNQSYANKLRPAEYKDFQLQLPGTQDS